MASLEEQTEQGFYGSPLYKRLGLPEFRSKEEIKEGLTSLAVGPVTGTLGLPSDILDLANLANDLSADYTGNILAKAIQPKLNELQEKYGRDAFDKEFTELTGIKSDASDVNQMVGELVSLGGLTKAGVSGAKVLTKTAKDVADQTKNLLKPKIDKAKDIIQTTVDQTKQAFQPQLATADGIRMIPDGTDINRDVVDTSKLESVVGQDSDVGQEAYSKFLQKGFDKVDPTPENMLQAIKETGGFISKDGKFRAIVDPTKAKLKDSKFFDDSGKKLSISKLETIMENRSEPFGVLKISDLFDYEDLYSQFDQLPPSGKPFINKYTQKPYKPLRDIKIQFINPKLEATQGGHYDVGDDVIRLSRSDLDLEYVRELLVHELQHAVQHRMDLTSGDNTRSFLKDINHRKIYEEDLKQTNDLGDARGSDISEKIRGKTIPDFLTGIDITNYYSGGRNIYVNDKVIQLSEQLNKTYFDIFKEKPFEVIKYSQDINTKIGKEIGDVSYGEHGVELTNMHIDFLIEALSRKINIREDGKLKKLFGDKEGSVLDGNKYVAPAENKPLLQIYNHAKQNISSTDLKNYDRQRNELFDQGHKTVDNLKKDIFDITNDNGEFEKHIKDIIYEKNNIIHRYVYGENSLRDEYIDFEDLNDGKGVVLIDSSNTAVIGDIVPNLEKQQELVDFYKNLLEDIKLNNIGDFDKFQTALKNQIDARVALSRTNTKNAASGFKLRNDYGLEVVNYTDDEVLKYENAKDKAFKLYLNKLGEKESKVAEKLKNIEDYPEAIKKEILENEEVLLQEDANKLYGKITGEELEPSAAVKQTDDILNNRHTDLTDEELITGYINTGFSGKSGVGRSELINRLKSKPELQQKSINKLQDLGVINEQTKTVPVYRLVITRGGKEIKPEKEISASLSIEAIQENLKFFEPKKGMLDEMYIVKYDVPKENIIGYLPAFKDDIKRGVNKKLKEKGFGQQKIRGYQTIGDPAKNAKNLLDKQDEIIVDVSNLEMRPMKSMMRETDDYTKGLPEASNLQKSIGTGRGFDEAVLKIAKGEIKTLENLNQHMLDFGKETLISPIAKGANTKLEQQARQEFLDYYKNYFNKAEETAVKQTDNLPKLKVDNPGKDFMGREYTDKKIKSALEDRNKAIADGLTETDTATVNIGNFSGQTAFFTEPVRLDPKMLKDVKGMMGEHKTRDTSRKLELLKKSIKEKGYEEDPILVHVREDGVPFVTEGNHRLAEALQSNRKSIAVEIKYLRGAENVEGILNPKTLGLKNKMNKGGVPTMQKKNLESQQLELFGGMKDQGGTKDPVSGNKVPVGSTKKEVRDDIPAQLSEGEFVLPADVVRYHGLEKIMGLRDQAKSGLGKMEAMGQMGNSDEATLPDDTPFMANTGGVAGVNIQDPAQLQKQQSVFQTTRPQGQQVQTPTVQTPTVQTPTVDTPTTSTTAPRTFKDTMGGTEFGQLPVAEQRQYKNTETGETKSFTFVNGKPVYPIPAGFVPIEEAGVEAPDVVKDVLVPTTQVTKEDKDRPSVSQVAGTGSFSLGNLNIGSLAGGAIGSIFGPIGSMIGSKIGGQLGQQDGVKPLTGDLGYGNLSAAKQAMGSYKILGDATATGRVGTGVGDTDVNTKGIFNNSFSVATDISDLHKYGGAMRDENGHTVYRTITEQVNSLKAAAKTGWFGGPLSPMEYYGLTSDNKIKYNSYAGEFGITEQNYGSGKGAELYQEFLNEMSKYNVSGTNQSPPKEGDGYLVSNGKAYKGTYTVNKTSGDMQFQKEGGGTIISSGGSGLVGDLTGSGQKTKPATGQDRPPTETNQDAAIRRKQEADAKAKADAMAASIRKKAEDMAEADRRKAEKEDNQAKAKKEEKAFKDFKESQEKYSGYAPDFKKGGLMTKPIIKNMKRGGLASR